MKQTFNTTKWASDEFRAEILRREPLEEDNTKGWIEVSWDLNGGNEVNKVKFFHSSTYTDRSMASGFPSNFEEYGTLPAGDFERLKAIVNEKLATLDDDFCRVEVNLILGTESPVLHLMFLDEDGANDVEVGVEHKFPWEKEVTA
jgi:hypothetical protein